MATKPPTSSKFLSYSIESWMVCCSGFPVLGLLNNPQYIKGRFFFPELIINHQGFSNHCSIGPLNINPKDMANCLFYTNFKATTSGR